MTEKHNRTQFDIMNHLTKALDNTSNKELSSTERLLIIGLYTFMDGDGSCFPSYSAIRKRIGLTRNTIASTIKKLVEKGWITYEKGNSSTSQSNNYQLNMERLGLDIRTKKVVSLNLWCSPEGNVYSCPSEYFKELNERNKTS